ncbi:WD repeat-containing protein 73 [Holothuria leucospilota]|uniref:WD repeat-containing protein 73 n=1 Tax=Holothuria leucospilota TaxID=206669 RepID=A0A9Q1BPW2_HOLLE|nr:WD repeat-containing protein 73 [Holothuria leucospilota]
MSVEPEDDWNWMIQSMKKYAHLHMYDLSQPTSVLEWMDQKTIFVADSSSPNGSYEMLLLSLPLKLTNSADDQLKLSKDRDFKIVCGGFHQQPVHAMAMVSDQLLLTSSPSDTDEIILWEIKEDEDVITQLKTHQGQRSGMSNAPFVAANPRTDAQVARGSFLENLVVVNLETGKDLWSYEVEDKPCRQQLASIDYIDDCNLLVCNASNGRLRIIDTRSPSSNCSSSQPSSSSIQLSLTSSVSLKPATWSCSVNFHSRHRRVGTDLKDGSR